MVFVILAFVAMGVLAWVPSVEQASALGAGGCDVNGNGSIDSYEYCSSWGWGWVRYTIGSSGPSGGFSASYNPDGYYWGSTADTSSKNVAHLCQSYGADSVWMFTVSTSNTNLRRVFGMQATGSASKDYGTNPDTVHNYYNSSQKLYDGGKPWSTSPSGGNSLGWFCYISNPSWNIGVSASVSPATAKVGDTVTWTYLVRNNGPATTNKAVSYTTSGDRPGSSGSLGSGTGSGGSVTPTSTSYKIVDSDAGKQLCMSVVATPKSNSSSSSVASQACVSVPVDLYGSWGQYAISATGNIKGMASGGGLSGGIHGFIGTLQGIDTPCTISNLTLANTSTTVCNGNNMGAYSSDSGMPNVVGRFVGDNGNYYTNTTSLNVTASGVKAVTTSLNIPATGSGASTIPLGKWLVIDARGQVVNINGDIKYNTGTVSNIKDIPQLVILAKDINIAANVKQVDAWLIAGDYIDTCSGYTYSGNLSRQVCNQQLLVNGPIMTSHLYMNRTFGEDVDAGTLGQSAEKFNLGGDAYLWSMAMASDGSITPVVSTELPPRY